MGTQSTHDSNSLPVSQAKPSLDTTAIKDSDYDDDDSLSMASASAQAGVKGIEAISTTWTQGSLVAAYVGIFLLAFCTSLEGQTTFNLTAYATSAFQAHSLIATVYVVQSVVYAVIKPPMAKIANVFGRLEAFSFSVFLYVIGLVQMAASKNVQTFASAQIFYAAGGTGLQILQQIFIADTSDLLNRALFSSLPDIPYLITVWIGPQVAEKIYTRSGWRWGYGVWTIILPVAFFPLALSLAYNIRKAARQNLLPPSPWKGQTFTGGLKRLWYELDIMGLLFLSAGISLILIPLTLGAKASSRFQNPSIIAMLVVGAVSFVAFPLWESSHRLAPHPFLSLRLLTDRTVLAGCTLGFFYFAVFYTSIQPYFASYLQVVHSQSIAGAGRVTNIFSFSSTISSILISLVIKYTRHYKYYITAGSCIYLLGVGLMIRYRSEESSIWQIVGTQIAVGAGAGMVNVPAQLGVQASVAHADVAAVTAIFLTIVEIGGAVGSAISGAIWSGNLLKKLQLYLPAGGEAAGNASLIFGNLTLAKSYADGSPERVAINRSYQETMNLLLIVSICFAAPLIPLSLVMRNYRLDRIDQKVTGTVIGSAISSRDDDATDIADAEIGRIQAEERRGWWPSKLFKKD